MKINEIVSADEKLGLAKLIFNNTFNQLSNALPQTPQPVARPITKPVAKAMPKQVTTKFKPRTSKRAPMAPAPKPLPKTKLPPQTPTQLQHQQQKSQQDYADAVKKRFDKDAAKIPKSLQPLPGNIISPIGSVDSEFQKKLNQARRQEEQNRDNGSKPHCSE
jgi:hypothetical protein